MVRTIDKLQALQIHSIITYTCDVLIFYTIAFDDPLVMYSLVITVITASSDPVVVW